MTNLFKIGDEVKIIANAHYVNGKIVPENAINIKLYVRNNNGANCIVARAKTGPILGEIDAKFLKNALENEAVIEPFIIKTIATTPIYQSPAKNSGVIKRLEDGLLLSIVDKKSGFGKIKMGPGWVELSKVKKY